MFAMMFRSPTLSMLNVGLRNDPWERVLRPSRAAGRPTFGKEIACTSNIDARGSYSKETKVIEMA